jgi:hypothetical protein
MTTLTILATWWILVHSFTGNSGLDVPRALGPYPSKDLCRIAGRTAMPDDRRFYTADELAKKDADEQERRRKRDAEIASKKPDKAGWIYFDCEAIHVGKDGKPDGQSSTSCISVPWSYLSAITDCVAVEDSKPK